MPELHVDFAEKQVDAKLGATEQVAATLPQYIDARDLSELNAGCTLVRCERAADQVGEVPTLVCAVTPTEHAAGMGYDGSEPFVINGKQKRPPVKKFFRNAFQERHVERLSGCLRPCVAGRSSPVASDCMVCAKGEREGEAFPPFGRTCNLVSPEQK